MSLGCCFPASATVNICGPPMRQIETTLFISNDNFPAPFPPPAQNCSCALRHDVIPTSDPAKIEVKAIRLSLRGRPESTATSCQEAFTFYLEGSEKKKVHCPGSTYQYSRVGQILDSGMLISPEYGLEVLFTKAASPANDTDRGRLLLQLTSK